MTDDDPRVDILAEALEAELAKVTRMGPTGLFIVPALNAAMSAGDLARHLARLVTTGDGFRQSLVEAFREVAVLAPNVYESKWHSPIQAEAERMTDVALRAVAHPHVALPDIVTVCASMRLTSQVAVVAERLTDEGAIVQVPLPHPGPVTDEVKAELAARHRAKIDRSTRVVAVVDQRGPGESVREEIAYARERGLPVQIVTVDGDEGVNEAFIHRTFEAAFEVAAQQVGGDTAGDIVDTVIYVFEHAGFALVPRITAPMTVDKAWVSKVAPAWLGEHRTDHAQREPEADHGEHGGGEESGQPTLHGLPWETAREVSCPHGYRLTDSCPGCDAEEDKAAVIGEDAPSWVVLAVDVPRPPCERLIGSNEESWMCSRWIGHGGRCVAVVGHGRKLDNSPIRRVMAVGPECDR